MPPSKKRKRSRQTTLPFSPSPGPAPATSKSNSLPATSKKPRNAFAALMRSPTEEFSHPISSPTPARPRINIAGYRYSDTDSEDDGDDAGKRWKKGKRGGLIGIAEARSGKSAGFFGLGGLSRRRVRRREGGSSSEGEGEEIQELHDVEVGEDHARGKRKTRSGSSRAAKRDVKEKAEKNKKSKKRLRVSSEEEDDDGDEDVWTAGKRGRLRHVSIMNEEEEAKEAAKAEKRKGADEEVPPDSGIQVTQVMNDKVKSWMIESDNGEDEKPDDPDLGSQARMRPIEKKGKGRRGKKVVIDEDDEVDEEGGENAEKEDMRETFIHFEAIESDHEEREGKLTPQRRARSGRGRKQPLFVIDDDDDDLPIVAPSRRRRLKSAGKSSPIAMAEGDSDLGSDAELAAQTPVMKSRLRYEDSPKKLTPFQKKLKELNAKRQGVNLVSEEEEKEAPPRRKALYDSYTSNEALDDVEDEKEEEEAMLIERAWRDGGLDSDIESFIVTDAESDPLGAPDDDDNFDGPIARIPIQFTSQSHASLKNHFKTVLQYILNLLLNPSFPRDDEYFTYALHAVDRKVDSFRDSVLKSEAWKSDFMRALKSRPGFEFDPEGGHGWENHCTACNRRDRNASYTVRFTGKRYDPNTFSDYESNSDSGDSEDEVGNIIPPSGQPFPVGRYCYERAEITHSFWHWKKGLRTALEEVLTQMGVFEKEVVGKLDKMKEKERWRWVDAKLGELERGGDVDLLWDMFQAQMKRAEEFMSRPRRYFFK